MIRRNFTVISHTFTPIYVPKGEEKAAQRARSEEPKDVNDIPSGDEDSGKEKGKSKFVHALHHQCSTIGIYNPKSQML